MTGGELLKKYASQGAVPVPLPTPPRRVPTAAELALHRAVMVLRRA